MFFALEDRVRQRRKNTTTTKVSEMLKYNVEGRISNEPPTHTPPPERILNSAAGSDSLLSQTFRAEFNKALIM